MPAMASPPDSRPAPSAVPGAAPRPAPGVVPSRRGVRPGWGAAYAAAAVLLAVAVFVQAVLVGQALYGTGSDFYVHGSVGNLSFALGIITAVLAGVSRVPRWLLVTAALALFMLFTQTGLGYVARESQVAGMWHVPLGVLTFALVVLQAVGAVAAVRGGKGLSS